MEFLVEIVTSVVGKIAEYTVAPVVHQLSYYFNYNRNMRNLKNQIEQLKEEKEKLQHLIAEAENKGEEIMEHVRNWQNKAGEAIENSNTFFEEEGQANTRCSNYGSFPNMDLRRRLSRKAGKMAEAAGNEIKEALDIFQSKVISNRRPLPSSAKSYETFDSRTSTSTKIMDVLRDPNASRIGVYGMAGVGKTTLAKEVEQQALKEGLFDVVVMVPISQTPDFKEIQQIIADTLQLQFEEKTVPTRAKRLRDQLMRQEKKILIILDDVWKKLELEEVGLISSRDDKKGFKMLLTSRSEDVCNQMDTDKNFAVGMLEEGEALNLFNRKIGDTAKSQNIQSLVPKIVKECAGLPLAIITVASALKRKSHSTWLYVLRQLERSTPTERVYSSIKMSYDSLDNNEARSLLVFCSLHREDAEVHIQQLLGYAWGFGLLQGITQLEEARNMVFSLVEQLKSSSLLLDGSSPEFVKLHDVVRDTMISIAAKDEHMYLIKDAVELEEHVPKVGDSIAISLLSSTVAQLPRTLVCPRLKLLFMFGSSTSSQVSNNVVFDETRELRVLLLTSINFERLQSCFHCLENLQTLYLNDCYLKDVTSIGELKHLKILNLARSGIRELPTEFSQLTSLKLLDLSNCLELGIIKPNVISSLTNLEELNMTNSFASWEADNIYGERSNASLRELTYLSQLSALYIKVKDASVLPKSEWLSEKLKRYHILIGIDKYFSTTGFSRVLNVALDHISQLDEYKIQTLLKTSEELELQGLVSMHDVVPAFDEDGFPQLIRLEFARNDQIRYVVDLMGYSYSSVCAFPNLESLSLQGLGNLESIFRGQLTGGSFSKLRVLKVSTCPKLKNLLPFSIAKQLEEIFVADCTLMEEIIGSGGEVVGDKIEFPQLRMLTLRDLPELKEFFPMLKMASTSEVPEEPRITENNSIPLFNQKITFPNLKAMTIRGIKSTKIWDCPSPTLGSFSKLKNILSSHMLASLVPNLTSLDIRHCEMLEVVFEIMDERSTGVEESVVIDGIDTPLRHLTLSQLSNLKHVWNQDPQGALSFQNLNEITIWSCPNLESLFPPSVAKSLLQLSTLSIWNCETLQEIVGSYKKEAGAKTDQTMLKFVFPKLSSLYLYSLPQLVSFCEEQCTSECMKGTANDSIQRQSFFFSEKVEFPNLRRLYIADLSKLKKLFSFTTLIRQLPNLTHLSINQCDMLEDVFDGMEASSTSNEIEKASQLQELKLGNLPKLKHVWSKDHQGTLIFQNLREVHVEGCPNLESLFPPSIAKGLLQFQKLRISKCELLKEIIADEEERTRTETLVNPKFVFTKLKSLILEDLPQLVSFYPGVLHTSEWPSLQSFQDEKSGSTEVDNAIQRHLFLNMENVIKNLEELVIWNCGSGGLKSLVPSSFSLQNLTSLIVSNCPGMLNLVTWSVAKSFGQVLRRMSIYNCPDMIQIIGSDDTTDTHGEEFAFSKLETLALHNLPILTCFYSGNCVVKFPNLETVVVSECLDLQSFCIHEAIIPKLDKIFTRSMNLFHTVHDLDYHFRLIERGRTFRGELWKGDINTTLQEMWRTTHPLTLREEDYSNKDVKEFSKPRSQEVLEKDPEEDTDSNSKETSIADSKDSLERDFEEDFERDPKENYVNDSEEESKEALQEDSENNLQEDDYKEQLDSENESEEDSNNGIEKNSDKSSGKDLTDSESKSDPEEDSKETSDEDFDESNSEEKAKEDQEDDSEKDSQEDFKDNSKNDSFKGIEDNSSTSEQDSEEDSREACEIRESL